MQLYPASRGFVSCVVRNFSHPSSCSENVAFARRVMQLQQAVEMSYRFKFVYLKIIRGKIVSQRIVSRVKGFKVSSAGGSHLVYEFYKIVVVVAFVGYL